MESFRSASISLSAPAPSFVPQAQVLVQETKIEVNIGSILYSIPGLSGGTLFSKEQVQTLIDARYPDGRQIVSLSSPQLMHDILGLAFNTSVGPERAVAYVLEWSIASNGTISPRLQAFITKVESKTCRQCSRPLRTNSCKRCIRLTGKSPTNPLVKGGFASIPIDVLTREFIFQMPTFDKARVRDQEEKESMRTSDVVVEGIEECKKCGGKRVQKTVRQTRSSDEVATVFYLCLSCNHNWRV